MSRGLAIGTSLRVLAMGLIGLTLLFACTNVGAPMGLMASAQASSSGQASMPGITEGTTRVRESVPTRIRIPSIGVNAKIMPLGLQSDGSLQVPPNAYLTGWFTGGPRPGEIGPSVIAGHVHWNDRWGVFERLSEMLPGDLISVIRADSTTITFRVTRVSHFKKTRFPTDLVYGNVDYVALRLITCSGYSSGRRAYLYNVVVFARSVDIPNAPIRTG